MASAQVVETSLANNRPSQDSNHPDDLFQSRNNNNNNNNKLMKNRWDDNNLEREGCFAWLQHWKTPPSYTVAGLQELYHQLLPTKVYHHRKTVMSGNADERCRMCGKASESVGHILAGRSAITQIQYLARHNKALKILFFVMLRSLDLITITAPCTPKLNQKQCTRTIVCGYHPRQAQQD